MLKYFNLVYMLTYMCNRECPADEEDQHRQEEEERHRQEEEE